MHGGDNDGAIPLDDDDNPSSNQRKHMLDPRTGNEITTRSAESAEHYLVAVDKILGSETGAAEELDKALALDPDFALALAARYMLAKDGNAEQAGRFKERALRAVESARPAERGHLGALFAIVDQPYASLAATEAYVAEHPNDMLVVSQLCGYLIFYGGARKLDRVLRIMEGTASRLPDDWACLARLGFAASEAGDSERGKMLVERAFELREHAPYVAHCRAHVLHDHGSPKQSIELLGPWLENNRVNAEGGSLYGHLQWHLALAEWQLGLNEQAWQRYRRYCSPETTLSGPVLTLADCGGFLFREYLRTGAQAPISPAVRDLTERFRTMSTHPFIALHVAGIFASAGDASSLEDLMQALRDADGSDETAISLQLVNGVCHFVAGRYAAAVETLAAVPAEQRVAIGGSHVERELVEHLERRAMTLSG